MSSREQSSGSLRNIDSVMGTMSAARSLAGSAINRADNEDDRLATQKLAGQTQRLRLFGHP